MSTKRIIVKEQVNNWNEAITIASQPLLQEQVIEQGYVEAMIESVNELGPYIVIAPEIAIAHARPNNNVHQVGLSLLKLNQHVAFCDEDHYASLIFVLSAIDNHSHLSILQNLATILGDNKTVQQLLNAKNVQEITTILKEHD
nr:PTS sugar transporter subunit IIA [Staphylococcus argenteus]